MTGPGGQRVLAVRCQVPGTGAMPGAAEFERVADAVQGFCPRLEVLRPGVCAIGARGPARYFGGEPALAGEITGSVTRLGYDCGIGVADGLFAALLAARAALTTGRPGPGRPGPGQPGPGQGPEPPAAGEPVIVPPGDSPAFLAPYPVGTLGQPELTSVLSRLGIRTLGEFARIPAARARDRFGPPGELAHRLARGLDPRPLAAGPPPADLTVELEFDPPALESGPVVFSAKNLASQLHHKLASAGLACVRMRVEVRCADGRELVRLWRHDGLLSELAVAERVRWQLDGWRPGGDGTPAAHDHGNFDPEIRGKISVIMDQARRGGDRGTGGDGTGGADGDGGTAGVIALRLVPDQLVHERGHQLGLWGEEVVSDRVARAAVRVQAMLGHEAVTRPVLAGGRSPGEQVVTVPFGEVRESPRPADRPWPGQIPAPAPATIYPEPRPARVTDSAGALVGVTGRGGLSGEPAALSVDGAPPVPITGWTGPWPVTERWWDPVNACRKARFQLVTVDGAAWLAVVRDGRWLIEASYD